MGVRMIKTIKEGSARLYVPNVNKPEQGRREGFYNPAMTKNRDISVACLAVLFKVSKKRAKNRMRICDALTATGVRAIRYKKEVGGEVWACDVNENAIKLARKNAYLNKTKINFVNKDANAFLSENGFDFVDIDPYGSPVGFIAAAGHSLGRKGYLAVTATDTAALNGVYPRVAERRYGIRSVRCFYSKELGTRILITSIIRILMQQDKAFQPLLCFQDRHYIRIFGSVLRGAKKCDVLLDKMKYIVADKDSWEIREHPSEKSIGPIYIDTIQKKNFCMSVLKELKKRNLTGQNIVRLAAEELQEPFYYDTHFLSKKYKKPLVSLSKIIDTLSKRHKVSRTVFCPTAIKTDAGLEKILAAME
ncbi:MAG: methyltransferase [Candidatus Aenigmarchaeota archaeon]|nr:methyltransferase [Candidatus Aenigmarchaeota archaeon]